MSWVSVLLRDAYKTAQKLSWQKAALATFAQKQSETNLRGLTRRSAFMNAICGNSIMSGALLSGFGIEFGL